MKKFLASMLAASFLLTGCFGSDDSAVVSSGEVLPGQILYENSSFSIVAPESWDILERDDFTSNIPDQALVGFRNNIKSEVFTANLAITQKLLDSDISSTDFTKSMINKAETSLVGFTKLSEKSYKIPSGENPIETSLTTFEGKKGPSEPIVRFQQINVIKNRVAFTITAAYVPNEDENIVKTLEEMLNSFSLN
ncbi:hypothetical protein KJ632_03495 [Patescibacteria group bacterium]|nr:hypothetical protein [Patescibacteria group bacterium]